MKFTKKRVSTECYWFEDECLMYIEQQPWQITHEEGEDNRDEDDAETDLLLLIPPPEPGDGQVDPDVHKGDQGKGEEAEDDQLGPAVAQDVHWVGAELSGHDPHQVWVLVTPDHLSLEKLWDIEEDGEDKDGEAVLHQSLVMAGHVLDDAVIVDRFVGCEKPLQRDSDRGEDGSSHGDVVQRIEEDLENHSVVRDSLFFRAELLDGVEHHGDDIDQVPSGQHGQKLIEEGRPYLGPSEEKYCSNISQSSQP